MSRASNALENFNLNHIFNKEALPTVTNMFLGLFLDDPGETMALTSEVQNGSNYARVTLSVLMSAASVGAIANATEVAFNVASNTWGTIKWLGVYDTHILATGRGYLRTSMTSPLYIDTGKQMKLAASNLVFTCD